MCSALSVNLESCCTARHSLSGSIALHLLPQRRQRPYLEGRTHQDDIWVSAESTEPIIPFSMSLSLRRGARRRQLVEMLTAESNRRGRAPNCLRPAIAAHVRWLRKQLAELDAALDLAVRYSPLWCEKARLLRSVPAVGSVTVITLLAHLPELGSLSRRKIAPWWESRPSTATVARCMGRARSGAAAPRSARCSTCARW